MRGGVVPRTRHGVREDFIFSNYCGVTCITPHYRAVSNAYQLVGTERGSPFLGVAMKDFAFKVNLVAVVRVRAADESVARQVVPEVLGAHLAPLKSD
jgi:hypothetical protein